MYRTLIFIILCIHFFIYHKNKFNSFFRFEFVLAHIQFMLKNQFDTHASIIFKIIQP